MTVTDVRKDVAAKRMTITCEFGADVDRIWKLWADPRQLERWWGSPSHPATFIEHDLRPGGSMAYYMTSPEGERYHGWWKVISVEPPHRVVVEDGFADSNGAPLPDMPTSTMQVSLEAKDIGTRMAIESEWESVEAMEKVLEMGMEEGIKQALSQIEDILHQAGKV